MLRFEVDIHTLVDGLKEVKRALSSKVASYVLSGVKIEGDENGVFLTTISSNSEMTVRSKLVAKTEESVLKVIESGTILIDAKRLIEYVAKAKTKLIKIEEVDETAVIVKAGRGKVTFHKMDANLFPRIMVERNETSFAVNSNCLLRGLQSTILFSTNHSTQPILAGILFKIRKDGIIVHSTDSFRAGKDKIDVLTEVKEERDIIVPAILLQKVYTLFSRGETVIVTTDGHWVGFEVGEDFIGIRLLEGNYPSLDNIFDSMTGGQTQLRFMRDELFQMVERALLFKRDNNTTLQMSWEAEQTTVLFSTKAAEIGGMKEELETQILTNAPLNIFFNAEFLKDAIRSLPKTVEEIELDMYGEMRPFSIREVGNKESIRIIVPVRME